MNLLPCPFCGGNNLYKSKNFHMENDNVKIYLIVICCLTCGADGPTIMYTDDPEKAWNTRIEPSEKEQ